MQTSEDMLVDAIRTVLLIQSYGEVAASARELLEMGATEDAIDALQRIEESANGFAAQFRDRVAHHARHVSDLDAVVDRVLTKTQESTLRPLKGEERTKQEHRIHSLLGD